MEIPKGEGVAKAKVLKEKYVAKLEFLEGWREVQTKKTFPWGVIHVDIFWNHTL